MSRRTKSIIVILLIVIILCICMTVWAVFFRKTDRPVLIPDHAPEEIEKNAEPISGESDVSKIDTPEGGGAIGIQYANEAFIDLSDNTVYLQYINPGKSTQNTVICVEIQGEIIARSGLISPGYKLKVLPLIDGASKRLNPGGYKAQFRILSYNPKSGEKSMIDAVADVYITVKE